MADAAGMQSAAYAGMNEYSRKMETLQASLEGIAEQLKYANIEFTKPPQLEKLDRSPLADVAGTIAQIQNLKIDTTGVPVDPTVPQALAPWTPPDTSLATYDGPDKADIPVWDAKSAPQPAEMPKAFDKTAPSAVTPDYINLTPLETVDLPDDPGNVALNIPDTITYVEIPTATFGGAPLDEIPPAGYLMGKEFNWVEQDYASDLLTELKQELLNDIVFGGYGINPADEQPLWERAREREMLAGETAIRQATAAAAARGFMMPPGALNAIIEGAQQAALEKISSMNREIALKRADMYVENRKFTIQQSHEHEQMMITYWGYKQERALKAAQASIEFAINIYNALSTSFNMRVQAYKTSIEAYNAEVQAALAPLERDKVLLELGKVRGEAYRTYVEAYKARVEGAVAKMEVNKQRIEQDRLRFEREKIKIEAYLGEVQGYKAMVDAKTAEYQGYATSWEGMKNYTQAYIGQVQGLNARVDAAYKVFDARFKGLIESEYKNRELELRGKNVEWEGYAAQANAVKVGKELKFEEYRAKLDGYLKKIEALKLEMDFLTRYYETSNQIILRLSEQDTTKAVEAGRFLTTKSQLAAQATSQAMQGLAGAMTGFASSGVGIAANITTG